MFRTTSQYGSTCVGIITLWHTLRVYSTTLCSVIGVLILAYGRRRSFTVLRYSCMVRIWLANLCLLCCVIYIAKHSGVMKVDALWCLTGLQNFAEFAVMHCGLSWNLYWLLRWFYPFLLEIHPVQPCKDGIFRDGVHWAISPQSFFRILFPAC